MNPQVGGKVIMSYLVLARKWRPQTFGDVLSQNIITQTLRNAIEQNRISHAYLFSGPRGVGKTTTARLLAKSMNCRSYDEPTPTPCNECTSCIEIAESRSPDVLEIDGASNRSVDDIQPLRERVQYAPQGRFLIVIIDEVHMLTNHAFNALLKTLEEPPPHVIFIFATTEPEKIPATIISRCQRYDFRRIPLNSIAERLLILAEKENIDLTDDAAKVIAKKADGAFRDALSLFDQIIAFAPSGQVTQQRVSEILGILPQDAFKDIAALASTGNIPEMLEILTELVESGVSPGNLIDGLLDGYRDTLVDMLSKSEIDDSMKSYSPKDLTRIIRLLSEAVQKMRYSKRPEFILEERMIYIAMMTKTTDIETLLTSLPDRSPEVNTESNSEKKN